MNTAKHRYILAGSTAILLLSLFAVAAKDRIQANAEEKALYDQIMSSAVENFQDISDRYAMEWISNLAISLPYTNEFLETLSHPVPLLLPPQSKLWNDAYSASFIDGLVPVVKDGITVFPTQLLLDSEKRTITIYNVNKAAIATIPIDDEFLPVEWAKQCFGEASVRTADRMQLYVEFILESDVDLYVALEMLKAEARQPAVPDFPIVMMAYTGPSVTNIKFVAAETTNGCVMWTIAYPDDYTNDLEIFGCTNLLEQDWSLLATTNVNLSTNWIEWVDLDSSNYVQRFYDVWNADADTDSDGLSDGQEKRLYGTDRINPDTDGDGVSDGTEIALGMNPLSASEDSDTDGIADGWEVLNFGDLDASPDIVVTNGGSQTIQQAINAASSGDIVLVLSGTYTNVGDKNLDYAGKGIYLLSEAGATSVTIDCQNSGRGFIFDSAETSAAIVSGFTITGGYTNDGAAIYCATSSPTIKYCSISGNAASGNGAGIYLYGSSPVITNCLIEGNTASGNGGGIYSQAKDFIHHWTGGSPGQGDPVYWCIGSSPSVVKCVIRDNLAAEGSAVYFVDQYPHTYLDPSDHDIGTPVVLRCSITLNSATNSSAVFAGTYVDATLENTMVVKNYTRAICNSLGNLSVINCTISDNVYLTGGYGAGIDTLHDGPYPGSTTIKNSIVDDNTPVEGQIFAIANNSLCAVSYTAYDPTPHPYVTSYASFGSGNITNDAQTTADGHILTTSPCIGAGTAAGAPSSDFDGETRSTPIDIGADQIQDTDGDGMPDQWELRYGLNPQVANSGSANTDGDELTDAQEYEAGTDPSTVSGDSDDDGLSDDAEAYYRTNPNDWDSDNDLFPDGWEITYGYNANSSTNPAPTADDDSDGLSNFNEIRYGTDPTETDSDSDGVSDGTEVTNGSDPADSSDGGSADNCVSIELVVGDHSGSHSERYGLEIGHVYHVAPEWGVLATNTYSFVKGQSYSFNVKWIDTTSTPDPDYDYTATIGGYSNSVTSTNGYVISDPDGILGAHGESTYDYAAGKTGTLSIIVANIDGDYNRTGTPSNSTNEAAEVIFTNSYGMVILSNCDDDDGDGEPDCSDNIIGTNDLIEINILEVDKLGVASNFLTNVTVKLELLTTNGSASSSAWLYTDRSVGAIGCTSTNLPGSVLAGSGTLQLGIEGRSFGEQIIVKLTLECGSTVLDTDEVRILVAPWIGLSNDRLISKLYAGFGDEPYFRYNMDLHFGSNNIDWINGFYWRQDQGEFGGQLTGTGQASPISQPVILDLDFTSEDFKDIISTNIGWEGSLVDFTELAGGAIEVSMPSSGLPYGRLILPDNYQGEPYVSFFEKQALQWPPVFLPVDWLEVGHVDEVMSVIPNDTSQIIAVGDLTNAISILNDYTTYPTNDFEECVADGYDWGSRSNLVAVYSDPTNATAISVIQGYLDNVASNLSAELNATIVRIPVAYTLDYTGDGNCKTYLPNSVNAVVANISGTVRVGLPNPRFHPFRIDIADKLSFLGTNGSWIVTDVPHFKKGEAHCTANTLKFTSITQ